MGSQEDTGRIKATLRPALRRLIFGEDSNAEIDAEMAIGCEVDRAHVVMLARQGLLEPAKARELLRAIEDLGEQGYAPLRGRHAPRGLYLLYEHHLADQAGPDVGGLLQLGRSRNDRGATIQRMRLRRASSALALELLRLVGELSRRAAEHREVLMPIYTHYQPAFPVTYGHYLAGVAIALERDLAALLAAMEDLGRCPLGAGAVGGTSVPIDARLTAELLGFDRVVLNSIDAVAGREVVLRLLSAASILGVTLSRCALDLSLWTTQEFGYLSLPDELVGSSSMMPQKRNVYVLEHVHGRASAALGAFTAATAAMLTTPFTNSIAVGTEGVSQVWGGLEKARHCVTILRRVVAEAAPNVERMRARAAEGFTHATALAERMALEDGLPFREAHKRVGARVAEAEAAGGHDLGLDPAELVRNLKHGGGAAPENVDAALAFLRQRRRADARTLREWRARWRDAARRLDAAAAAV
jgi:argininosuccinate lyase